MATTSTIAYMNKEGVVKSIYCHYDGYLSYNGAVLSKHYNTLERAKALVELGNMSVLQPMLEPTEEHSFDAPQSDVCVFYDRDRGESDQEPETFRNEEHFRLNGCKQEYCYLFKDNGWYLLHGRSFILLAPLLTTADEY